MRSEHKRHNRSIAQEKKIPPYNKQHRLLTKSRRIMSLKASSTHLVLSTLAGASIAAGYYWYCRHKSQQPRTTLHDLRGNFYATGSDVCRLYRPQIPGLVVVITGTSSGLGAITATLLGSHGATVIMGNRRPHDSAVQQVQRDIERGGGKAISLELDLASLASVQSFSKQVKKSLEGRNIHALIHNAGVAFIDRATGDGYQTVWQVNALAPALLTELLLPNICPENGRVIFISSEMHRACFGNIANQCPPCKDKGSSPFDYARSKACQIMQALELNHRGERTSNKKIRGFAIEPGLVRTSIGRHTWQLLLDVEYALLGPFLLRTTDQGCSSTLLCTLAPMKDLGEDSFYFADCQPKTPKGNCTNLDDARRLHQVMRNIWKSYLD